MTSSPIIHDTLTFERKIPATPDVVWRAYMDPSARAVWSAPAGEALVFDRTDFRPGGRDEYRCGPVDSLPFHGILDYLHIASSTLIVYTDTVTTNEHLLSTALQTWVFTDDHDGHTTIKVTNQVTSFVGDSMIEGHRNGHLKTLDQLEDFVLLNRTGPGT
ncbi:SRPBCC domain-containing protein [Mycolicibacterium komossense]|nr:SRPBCC domain-containing protein [Mycolicibacterium komossense]